MKKILFIFLILLIIGCKQEVIQKQTTLPEPIVTKEKITYYFERQEIEPDIFLEKKLDMNIVGNNIKPELTLIFEGNKEIEYIELIPESFAPSKDDIVFSLEPESIEKGSYKVKWALNVREKLELTIKFKSAVAVGKSKIQDFFGQKRKSLITTLAEESAEEYILLKEIKRCDNTGETCQLDLIKLYPYWFAGKVVCNEFKDKFVARTCKAILNKDYEECEGLEQEIECKKSLYDSLIRSCKDIEDWQEQDTCFMLTAEKADYLKGCDKIRQPLLIGMCKTSISQENHCDDLNKNEKSICCAKLIDKEKKADCLDEELEEEEEDTEPERKPKEHYIPEHCKTASTKEEKANCMWDLIVKQGEGLELCNKVSNIELADWCYYAYVQKNAVAHICNSIVDEQIKDWCLNK